MILRPFFFLFQSNTDMQFEYADDDDEEEVGLNQNSEYPEEIVGLLLFLFLWQSIFQSCR